MKTLIASILTTSLISTAFAKNPPDSKLPKEIQPILGLVGEWKATNGVAVLDGKKRRVDFTISCSPAGGGMAVQCLAKFDIEGLGRFEENDLFGYDPGQNRYHWFSVTQMGEAHDHVALPPGPNDKQVTFAYSGIQHGKPMQEVITLAFVDDHKIEFKNLGTVGGESAWKMSATMIKK